MGTTDKSRDIILYFIIGEEIKLTCYFIPHALFALTGIGVEVLIIPIILAITLVLSRRLGPSRGFEFLNTLYLPCGDALALGLKALDGNKLLGVDIKRLAEGIVAAKGDLDARIYLTCEQHLLTGGIVAKVVLLALGSLHLESLHIGIAGIVGIEEHCRPHLSGVVFLDDGDIVLIVVVGIEVSEIIVAILEYDKYLVVVVELAEQSTVVVVVETVDIGVKPHLASAEGGMSVTLETDAVDGFLGEQVALRRTSLDKYL